MDLIQLSHAIADPSGECVILGEGNTSERLDEHHFRVKASGHQLATIGETGFVTVEFEPILAALDGPDLSDPETAQLLRNSARGSSVPSTETFMHAYLLSLPGIAFVAHTHPVPLVSILSTELCEKIKDQRLFPDEIVCCGPSACLVPYAGPGLELAKAIRSGTEAYIRENGALPKTIWIRNHGLITLGATASEALTATRMSVKAARIWLGALQTGAKIVPLTRDQVERIHSRPDEHHRQRLLWQIGL